MKIVLASGSPRRKELLRQIGLDFEVILSDMDENCGISVPELLVEELSAKKAMAIYELLKDGAEPFIVIGADTVVSCDGKILGKPKDDCSAKEMLGKISGRTHEVYTGVTLIRGMGSNSKCEVKTFHEMTKVKFVQMTDAEIDEYVAGGDCMDKAGAYGIQGLCARYISGIEGDYNNVVGLPVCALYREIKEWIK